MRYAETAGFGVRNLLHGLQTAVEHRQDALARYILQNMDTDTALARFELLNVCITALKVAVDGQQTCMAECINSHPKLCFARATAQDNAQAAIALTVSSHSPSTPPTFKVSEANGRFDLARLVVSQDRAQPHPWQQPDPALVLFMPTETAESAAFSKKVLASADATEVAGTVAKAAVAKGASMRGVAKGALVKLSSARPTVGPGPHSRMDG